MRPSSPQIDGDKTLYLRVDRLAIAKGLLRFGAKLLGYGSLPALHVYGAAYLAGWGFGVQWTAYMLPIYVYIVCPILYWNMLKPQQVLPWTTSLRSLGVSFVIAQVAVTLIGICALGVFGPTYMFAARGISDHITYERTGPDLLKWASATILPRPGRRLEISRLERSDLPPTSRWLCTSPMDWVPIYDVRSNVKGVTIRRADGATITIVPPTSSTDIPNSAFRDGEFHPYPGISVTWRQR
jgi:hypothetical protein